MLSHLDDTGITGQHSENAWNFPSNLLHVQAFWRFSTPLSPWCSGSNSDNESDYSDGLV